MWPGQIARALMRQLTNRIKTTNAIYCYINSIGVHRKR